MQLFTGITGFLIAFFMCILYVAGVRAVSEARMSQRRLCSSRSPPLLPPLPAAAAGTDWLTLVVPPSLPPPPLQARGLFSFVLDALWVLFWLVAAACASAVLADGLSTSNMKGSVAFCWISW